MRNPYIVGGWVRGQHHYGREALIDHLLHSPVDAVWVIGNRRMGKTSLLRQLEYLTLADDTYVPLYQDMEGCSTFAELSQRLVYAVEDVLERFQPLGLDLKELEGRDLPGQLRLLRQRARRAGRKVLLLCDEAEVLLLAGQRDPQMLASLRGELQQREGLRVVVASTRALSRLNDLCRDWDTSPFLFGFGLRNLFGLDPAAAEALIRQTQGAQTVDVAPELVQEIRYYTNDHPYLIQYLCQRLFEEEGHLQPIAPPDLVPTDLLAHFFEIDYRHLTADEQAILRQVAAYGTVNEAGLQRATGISLPRLRAFLFGLTKLGYLREREGGWAAHNNFFEFWLQANVDQLPAMEYLSVSERTTQEMLIQGQKQEAEYLQQQLRIQKRNLQELEMQSARQGVNVPLPIIHEIEHAQTEIERIAQELGRLTAMKA
ncbi:MAG: hypothetical protein H8D78_21180 [Chloroflexi bacterium]|nr:hypothetical protein [Chloroflexota bacterium]